MYWEGIKRKLYLFIYLFIFRNIPHSYKIKREFFNGLAEPVLLYGCTTLVKRLMKKLDDMDRSLMYPESST